jgi:hypothetical protein
VSRETRRSEVKRARKTGSSFVLASVLFGLVSRTCASSVWLHGVMAAARQAARDHAGSLAMNVSAVAPLRVDVIHRICGQAGGKQKRSSVVGPRQHWSESEQRADHVPLPLPLPTPQDLSVTVPDAAHTV